MLHSRHFETSTWARSHKKKSWQNENLNISFVRRIGKRGFISKNTQWLFIKKFLDFSGAIASPGRYTCEKSLQWPVICLDFYFVSGLQKLLHPAIPDGRTWSKFGEHGKDGKHQPDDSKVRRPLKEKSKLTFIDV